MVNVNKTNTPSNAPYYILGSIATLALLASGVLITAPYAQFLAPIVALNLGVPLIAVCAVFSVIAIAFSAIAINKNKTISHKETQLAEKEEELKDRDCAISVTDGQLSEKLAVINKLNDQLAKNARKIKSQSKFVIDSYINGQQTREERREKKQANSEDNDMHLDNLFENTSAESEPNTQHTEQTKVAPKKTSGGFSTKLVFGAKAGTGIAAAVLCANGLLSRVSDLTSLANNATGVDNFFGNLFVPNSSSALPVNPQDVVQNQAYIAENMLEASQKRAKKNFGIKNPREYDFCEKSAPIQTNETVEQGISTSVYSVAKDRFFSLFTSKNTSYNPESYTNGIAYEAASKKQAVNESVVGESALRGNTKQAGTCPADYTDKSQILAATSHVKVCFASNLPPVTKIPLGFSYSNVNKNVADSALVQRSNTKQAGTCSARYEEAASKKQAVNESVVENIKAPVNGTVEEPAPYNPESYTNGIAYEAASKKQAVNESVAENISVPYAQFLAPIVALNLGVPLIAVCAVFSVITIAFSAIAIKKNQTISHKETQLAEKEEELKDRDCAISVTDGQLSEKLAVINKLNDQLAKKAREIEAKNKFIINSDVDSQKIHQERRTKKQAEVVEGDDMHLEDLFKITSAQDTQSGEYDDYDIIYEPEVENILAPINGKNKISSDPLNKKDTIISKFLNFVTSKDTTNGISL